MTCSADLSGARSVMIAAYLYFFIHCCHPTDIVKVTSCPKLPK